MLKKILTCILSLTLMTSHCYAVDKPMFQKSKINTNQTYKSYYFQEDDEFFDEFDEENLMKKEEQSRKTKLNWILGSSIPTVLALVLTASLVCVKDNKIEKLLKKLEQENIKINDNKILCELTCSAIQGLGYIEGTSRNIKANKEFLFKLVKKLVFLKAYDGIDRFFNLGVYKTETNPDLLALSHTHGDGMVSEHGHSEEVINDQMKKSDLYIEKIKEKFDKLSMNKAFDELNLYSDKTDKNINAKLALLGSLTIINMESKKLDNLINSVVRDL